MDNHDRERLQRRLTHTSAAESYYARRDATAAIFAKHSWVAVVFDKRLRRLSPTYRGQSGTRGRRQTGSQRKTFSAGLSEKVSCRSQHQTGRDAESEVEERRYRGARRLHQQISFEKRKMRRSARKGT